MIRQFTDHDINGVVSLFNKHCGSELVYKPWTIDSFKEKFINNPHFSYECTFVYVHNEEIIGFGNGLYKKIFLPNEKALDTPGYITMIIVDKNYRRQGIGSILLKRIEEVLRSHNKKRLDCIFFNPIHLEWYIPNTKKHEHNNAPGVMYPSAAYDFFLKHHYNAVAKENAYHLDLIDFSLPQYIIDRISDLNQKGITIEYFDKNRHTGFKDLFDSLGNESWRHEITNACYGENPRPVLVPVYQNKIIGFTGPLYVEKSGRGYFAGIGVHPDYRDFGVGKTLFFKLCENLKKEGAGYMTLFTGESNPARRMYEACGFEIVKSWYVMRKELSNE